MRAIEILKSCDIILCEDTRITNRLLIKYDIKNKKLVLYNENSDEKSRKNVLKMLQSGLNIALVSDAGTPLISDPGYKLIAFLRQNNIKIIPIPGPSSVISALCASGLQIENFAFLGFCPTSKTQRQNFLKNAPNNMTFAFFESPNRFLDSLEDVFLVLQDRKISVAKEITKIHEEILTDKVSVLIEFFKKNPEKIRGEFIIIVEKPSKKLVLNEDEIVEKIEKLMKSGLSLKDLSTDLAEIYGLNKKEIYNLALKINKNH